MFTTWEHSLVGSETIHITTFKHQNVTYTQEY